MGFCPKCRIEYVLEVTKCSDCGEKLVEILPEIEILDVEWIPLPSVPGVVYAQMIKEALEQNGIPSYVQSLWLSGGLGVVTSTSMPGVSAKIMVPKTDYKRALEIQEGMVDHM
jgi:hypothetical protein